MIFQLVDKRLADNIPKLAHTVPTKHIIFQLVDKWLADNIVGMELKIPSEHCLSCRGTSRKPVLDHKYYGKRIQHAISGLGTFINNIESIGQDGCMTDKVSQDRFLDTLA